KMIAEAARRLSEAEAKKLLGVEHWVHDVSWNEALELLMSRPTVNIEGLIGGYTGPGGKTILPGKATAKPDLRLVPDMTAARTLPTSTTSSNRKIPKFTAWMAQCALLPNCSTHWRRQTERRQADFRLVEMEISVALAQADGSPKQFTKMFFGEHRGFRPVGLN